MKNNPAGKQAFLWLLIFTLVVGSLMLPAAPAQAETTETTTTAYAFANLVNAPNDPDWNVAATNPPGIRLTATSFQLINAALQPTVNGEYIKINFYAPESRFYDINMVYWKNVVGGTVDIAINDQTVAENFSFYHTFETRANPDTASLASGLKLSKGMHTLTLTAKGTQKLASNGRYYAYLYLSQFQLIGKEPFTELDTVTLSAPKTTLMPGESVPLTTEAKLSDGTPVSVTESVYYESSNPAVLQVTVDEGGAVTATALSEGAATVTAEATFEGATKQGSLSFLVSNDVNEPPNIFIYDFKDPIDSTIETAGWEISDFRLPLGESSYRRQEYGIQVQANAVGQYIAFDFLVPEAGIYQVNLNGAGASSGASAAVSIDGAPAGEYNFYSAAYLKEKGPAAMRTFELSEGIHRLRLEVKQRAGYFHMYPGELKLVEADRLPNLLAVQAAIETPELMAGQTTKLFAMGQLEDGYEYNLNAVPSAVKSYESSNGSVATVNADGMVTAVGSGTVTLKVSVTLNGVTMEDTIGLTVNDKQLADVEVRAEAQTVMEGGTTLLTLAGYSNDGTAVNLEDAEIRYASSNPSVASVDAEGTVTALAAGNATLEVSVALGGVTVLGTVEITVVPPALETIAVKMYRTNLFVGDSPRIM